MWIICLSVRLIVWLDHARTDNECDQAEKDRVNYGSYECLEQKREKVETDLKSFFSRRQNLQNNICNVLRSVERPSLWTDIYRDFSVTQLEAAWPQTSPSATRRGRGSSSWRR